MHVPFGKQLLPVSLRNGRMGWADQGVVGGEYETSYHEV
jgi:hypothetical protein